MAYPGNEDDGLELGEELKASDEAEEQLVLADEDESLPWLESDEYEEEGSFDWRLVSYAVIGLLVVGSLLSAIWWFTRDRAAIDVVPDGSTIAAPEGSYKQRPDDPGGMEVAGTGDQAFEVAEGKDTEGRIASNDGGGSDARPSIDRSQGEDSGNSGNAETVNAVYVQIGAYGSRADAQTAWSSESTRYSVLSGMRHRIIEGDVSGSTVYRLQVIAGDRASADATCRAIRNAGGACYIR